MAGEYKPFNEKCINEALMLNQNKLIPLKVSPRLIIWSIPLFMWVYSGQFFVANSGQKYLKLEPVYTIYIKSQSGYIVFYVFLLIILLTIFWLKIRHFKFGAYEILGVKYKVYC